MITNKYILKYKKVIEYEARKYPIWMREELFQEGCIGLIKAETKFDDHKGIEFITYAIHYVRSMMREFYKKEINKSKRNVSYQEYMVEQEINFDLEIIKDEASRFFKAARYVLTKREHDIIQLRYQDDPEKYTTLGKRFNTSGQAMQDSQQRALEKIRNVIEGSHNPLKYRLETKR